MRRSTAAADNPDADGSGPVARSAAESAVLDTTPHRAVGDPTEIRS